MELRPHTDARPHGHFQRADRGGSHQQVIAPRLQVEQYGPVELRRHGTAVLPYLDSVRGGEEGGLTVAAVETEVAVHHAFAGGQGKLAVFRADRLPGKLRRAGAV